MRLIDADDLLERWKYRFDHSKSLEECIKTQPTAYDVERVVAELEEAKEVIRKLLCSEYGSSCQFCIHDKNPDARCCNIGGSGSWCCENAKWNGKIK